LQIALKPFKSNRILQAMILWLVAVWILAAINPLYPRDWLLENLLVIGCSALLLATYRRFQFSNVSYGLFTVFVSLHLVGSHYTYSETPFGFWMQDWFGFERNHFDRIVHFSFGLLIAYPMREILLRSSGLNKAWSYFITLNCILAFSAIYEVIEAITAVVVSPELGAAYLGTQGDEWDAQKDAGLAFLGSIVAMLITWAYSRTQHAKSA
jgi:putative membrane protein